MYPYRDENGEFKASLEAIEPDGHLLLRDEKRYAPKKYAFKRSAIYHITILRDATKLRK